MDGLLALVLAMSLAALSTLPPVAEPLTSLEDVLALLLFLRTTPGLEVVFAVEAGTGRALVLVAAVVGLCRLLLGVAMLLL